MNPFLVRKVLYPLHEGLQGRRTVSYMREMDDSQWWSAQRISDYQLTKLRRLLVHARKTVPYYGRVLDGLGLRPEELSWDDLVKLPIMDKEIFKANEQDIISEVYRDRLIRLRTGSSTGTPMWFYSCTHTQAYQNAAKMRCRSWWGIRPGDTMFEFWASPIELSRRGRITVLKDQLFMNHYMLSALDMTPEVMTGYVELMNRRRPKVIVGYPSAMELLSQHIRDTPGLQLHFAPKGVVVTAEVLLPRQRELVQEVFGAPVINEYGARDGGLLAYECPHGSMHIVAENVVLEVDESTGVDEDSRTGDVLVTNLESVAYPFVRYRVGDQVTLSDRVCTCGRGLPTLEKIVGRKTDWLVDSTGKRIHGLVVAHTIGKVQGVKQFQIVQDRSTALTVKVVRNAFYEPRDDHFIVESMRPYFSGPMEITVVHVDAIDASSSGKHRFIVSNVSA